MDYRAKNFTKLILLSFAFFVFQILIGTLLYYMRETYFGGFLWPVVIVLFIPYIFVFNKLREFNRDPFVQEFLQKIRWVILILVVLAFIGLFVWLLLLT